MWRQTRLIGRIAATSANRQPPTPLGVPPCDPGPPPTSSATGSHEPAPRMSLQGLAVAAYFQNSETAGTDEPIAIGHITAQISESVYAVFFEKIALSPVIEVGSRVYVTYRRGLTEPVGVGMSNAPAPGDSAGPRAGEGEEAGGLAVGGSIAATAPAASGALSSYLGTSGVDGSTIIGGLVAKVNGNGTFGVLLDNDRFELAVPRDMIALSEGRSKFISNEKFQELLRWVKSAGVDRRSDQESTSCILYHRGWRAEKLYLLESADVHCLSHLNKCVRLSVLEKSEWERDQHRHRREQIKERIKEKDVRYILTKYSSTLSRSNIRDPIKGAVPREAEEQRVRQILRQQDVSHPRIVVFSGFRGCGKSSLVRTAIRKEKMSAVLVDIRENEDVVRTIVKSLGVQHIEGCGNLLDFLVDASEGAKKFLNGVSPLIVVKLHEGSSLMRVYNELVALACDRRLCHVVIEVPIESLTLSMAALPRLDFHLVPNFTPEEAFRYTNHMIDPIEFLNFIEVAGTNSNDIDELLATVRHGMISASAYTNQKLIKAMRQLEAAWSKDPSVREAVINLAKLPFETGQREGYDYSSLRSEALRDIVMYNPVSDVWMFHQKVFHTAARCWQ